MKKTENKFKKILNYLYKNYEFNHLLQGTEVYTHKKTNKNAYLLSVSSPNNNIGYTSIEFNTEGQHITYKYLQDELDILKYRKIKNFDVNILVSYNKFGKSVVKEYIYKSGIYLSLTQNTCDLMWNQGHSKIDLTKLFHRNNYLTITEDDDILAYVMLVT